MLRRKVVLYLLRMQLVLLEVIVSKSRHLVRALAMVRVLYGRLEQVISDAMVYLMLDLRRVDHMLGNMVRDHLLGIPLYCRRYSQT